jgi:hypothetical protein
MKAKLYANAFGKLSEDEINTLDKLVKTNARVEAQELNRIATEYTSKAEKYGVPGDLIVLDSKDFGESKGKVKTFTPNQKK